MRAQAAWGDLQATFSAHKKLAVYCTLFCGLIGIWPVLVLYEFGVTKAHLPFVVALGGLLALTGIFWFASVRSKIFLHEHALVRSNLFGSKVITLDGGTLYFHQRIAEMLYGVVETHVHINLDVANGKRRLRLESRFFQGLDVLSAILAQREMTQIYPRARETYLAGGLVDFGAIRIEGGKLLYKKLSLPVADVRRMTLGHGVFALTGTHGSSPYFSLNVAKIGNMTTLFRLLEEFTPPNPFSSEWRSA